MITLVVVSALIEIRYGRMRQLFQGSGISNVTSSLRQQGMIVVTCVFIAADKNLRGWSSEHELSSCGVWNRVGIAVAIKNLVLRVLIRGLNMVIFHIL